MSGKSHPCGDSHPGRGLDLAWKLPRVVFILLFSQLLNAACLGQSSVQQAAVVPQNAEGSQAEAAAATSEPGDGADTGVDTLAESPSPADNPEPAWTEAPHYPRAEARVVRVIDGDTIRVLVDGAEYPVRYIGIDTPETRHPDVGVEPFGLEAAEANSQLLAGGVVFLEKDVSEVDRYGRLLRYVYLSDGRMVNAELVRLGMAQVSTWPPDVRYQDLFLELQADARAAGRGLWGE
jgi:micrococcal nuclease